MSPTHSNLRSASLRVLMVASAGRSCALSLVHVREIMRPLPVERFAEAPAFVLGVSVIRGASVPVVDLGLLLGAERSAGAAEGRYVTLKLDGGDVALSVGEVVGISDLPASELSALPGLVDGAGAGVIEALTTLDARLLRVLRASSVLSEAARAALLPPKAAS